MVLGVTSERAGRLAKKRFRTRPIPFVVQEHIDNLSVFIDGTIPVQFVLATEAEDFVDGPLLSHAPSMRTERGGQLGAKVCTQFSAVRAVTSMCRSANKRTT